MVSAAFQLFVTILVGYKMDFNEPFLHFYIHTFVFHKFPKQKVKVLDSLFRLQEKLLKITAIIYESSLQSLLHSAGKGSFLSSSSPALFSLQQLLIQLYLSKSTHHWQVSERFLFMKRLRGKSWSHKTTIPVTDTHTPFLNNGNGMQLYSQPVTISASRFLVLLN